MTADQLLKAVRNYLNITWVDPDLDEKLNGYILRGMAYVSSWAADRTLEFNENSKEVELLLDYCLYVHNYSFSLFYDAYLPELNSLQMAMEVLNERDREEATTA